MIRPTYPPQVIWLSEKPVGEIVVDVTLKNAADRTLARRGELPWDRVRTCRIRGLVDTGAARSVLPQRIVDELGLGIAEQLEARYADGRVEWVGVTDPVVFHILGRETGEEALVLGDEILIGQTVLEKLDLLADCRNQRVITNPEHPNGPQFRV